MKNYEQKLLDFYSYLNHKSKRMIGYPANLDYDYSFLYDFFKLSINNIGDPLSNGPYQLKAHSFEKEVIEFYAGITGIKDQNFWGYVTNGGTEGNMYGLYIARELYANSVVYYSKDAHYSIPKILKLLKMKSISIATNSLGEMDIDDLRSALQANRTKTPIILATIGTTMLGANDHIPSIQSVIRELAFQHHYIHCDAALGGMILPFCESAPPIGLKYGVHSISVSGHKMFGSPMPCGIVLAQKQNVDRIGNSVEYIGALDTTLSGSRNGHTTLLLWYAIEKNGKDGFTKIVRKCLENADYLIRKLQFNHINAWRNNYSITVVLPKPSEQLVTKWQLATQDNLAHIITMPHVTKADLDEFIRDYISELKSIKLGPTSQYIPYHP